MRLQNRQRKKKDFRSKLKLETALESLDKIGESLLEGWLNLTTIYYWYVSKQTSQNESKS